MSTRRILLVEDDEGLRQIASLSLSKIGRHEVLAVDSGAAALSQAEAFAPELLVLDVNMPDMDGPETLQALRKLPSLAAVPAIFLTARTLAREVAMLRGLGAVDVIAKPFEPRGLCARVAQVFAPAPAPTAPVADGRPSVLVARTTRASAT
ncbi:response regulator [Ramlibacter montanisoli]|uniref:Response regulator n=1 Tax=Ramlibacter montanisoli TaxID=2732512 RepID=A0A849K1J8_9BURK|nr:response regulator [Ramlibacter montanisoli]NNU42382.1 response regulator [Ramlibacter montanisoli]